jgi:hypothetical protein
VTPSTGKQVKNQIYQNTKPHGFDISGDRSITDYSIMMTGHQKLKSGKYSCVIPSPGQNPDSHVSSLHNKNLGNMTTAESVALSSSANTPKAML